MRYPVELRFKRRVKGIFRGIEHAFGLVEGDVFDAQVLEDGEEDFSDVGKGDGA